MHLETVAHRATHSAGSRYTPALHDLPQCQELLRQPTTERAERLASNLAGVRLYVLKIREGVIREGEAHAG
ncbi:MAG TPA: hypothetical protein VEY92_05715 [Pseudoxanthomonas sp.]|nr:hypothetical protein [Pseudoxanthomonas sp.]